MASAKRFGVPAVLGCLALGACGSTTPPAPASATADCSTDGGGHSATTASYLMVAVTGKPEEMYSQSEAAAHRGKGGEVMLGGEMTDASGPSARHLEIHICSRATGKVVTGAQPVIVVTDTTAQGAPQPVAVAIMQGVDSGPGDIHYGNNVSMPPGHSFAITVSLNGEKAAFTLPASG